MLSEYFTSLFPLAVEVKYRTPIPKWMKWAGELYRFLQHIFFTLDFCKHTKLASRPPTLLRILNNAGLLNSWLYFAEDSNFVLSFQVVFIITTLVSFYYIAQYAKSGKYVSKFFLYGYRLLFDFIFPIFQVHACYCLPASLINLFQSFKLANLTLFFLNFLSMGLFTVAEYITMVFFRPNMFLMTSILDVSTGTTDLWLYCARSMTFASYIFLASYNTEIIELIIYLVYPIFVIYVIFKRIAYGVNLTSFGSLLNDGPTFAAPFILLSHLHPCKYFPPILVLIIMLTVYYLILWILKQYLKKNATKIVLQKSSAPWYLPVTNALLLRYAAKTDGNIEEFTNYMLIKLDQDPEAMIEIIRFLAIFKSQRNQLLMMLSVWKQSSLYYNYQFYLFKKIMAAGNELAPDQTIEIVDRLHRNYIVMMSMFWAAREKKNYFEAFNCAIKAATMHCEMYNQIKYTCFFYHFDPYIYNAYSEFMLIGLAEPMKSLVYRRYSATLKDNPGTVADPFFRRVAHYYPISSERFSSEFSSSNHSSSTTKSSNSISGKYTFSQLRFHIDNNTIYREESKDTSYVAMFVEKSKRFKTHGIVISFILTILYAAYYTYFIDIDQRKIADGVNNIKGIVSDTIRLYKRLTVGIYLKEIIDKSNISFDEVCINSIKDIYGDIIGLSYIVKDEYNLYTSTLSFLSDYVSRSTCKELRNSSKLVMETLDSIKINYNYFHKNVSEVLKVDFNKNHFNLFLLYVVIAFIGSMLTFSITFNMLRTALNDIPAEAVRFLASKERLSFLLLKKSLESYDLFKILFHEQPKEKPTSIKRAKIPKIINKASTKSDFIPPLKSQHFSLKDAKLAISFLGTDEKYLKASNFGLMNRFLGPTSTIPKNLNDDNDWSDSTSNNDADYVLKENIERIDIVSNTVNSVKKELNYFGLVIFCLFITPWLPAITIIHFSTFVIDFQQKNNNIYLLKLKDNIDQFFTLPRELYINITVKNISERIPDKYIHKLSHYSKMTIPYIEDTNRINSYSLTGWFAWSILAYELWILCIIAMYHMEKDLNLGFDSLFHFPRGYLDDLNKPKDAAPEEKLPSNILELVVSSNSRYINHISPNCEDLISIPDIDIIGKKYDEVFEKEDENSNIRLFKINPHKTKKFIESSFESGRVERIALLDEMSGATSNNTINHILQKHIPQQMAKLFCGNNLKIQNKQGKVVTYLVSL